jgi:hypothetical protein
MILFEITTAAIKIMRLRLAASLLCLVSQSSSAVAFAPSARSNRRLFGSSVLYNDKAARHDVGGSPLGTSLKMLLVVYML